MRAEEIYLENLRLIERIATFVARRSRLNEEETAELTQEVRVRLLDNDYAVIRKFQGRSSFSTYLHTVILRLYHQWRVEQWGKWRPSAEAKRLGDKAIALERMLTRDGLTLNEAVETLTTRSDSPYTRTEIEAIYLRLPVRTPRPIVVSDEVLPDVVSVEPEGAKVVDACEDERAARQTAAAMDGLIERMEAEDRLILQMRFWDELKVPEIARSLNIEQKKLYKRLDKLFGVLRRGLEEAGVTRQEVGAFLSRGDQEIRLDILRGGEVGVSRPSHLPGGKEVLQ
jgi:RNA polymerase sigma factor for flagellar operon FliA